MSFHLRTIFALSSAVLISLISLLLSWTIGNRASDEIERQIGSSLKETSYHMAEKLDYFMWSRAAEIDIISKLKDMKSPDTTDDIQMMLNQLKISFPVFTWVGYLDPQGNVIASTDGILKGANIDKRPVYLEGRKGRFIGDVHEAVLLAKLLPNPTGEPLQFVDISTPIYDQSLELKGVLAAHLSWEWANEVKASILAPLVEKKHSYEVFIISKNGNTVLLGPKDMIGKTLDLQSLYDAQTSGGNGWRMEIWPDGERYLTGYAYGDGYQNYPGLGWTVIIREPAKVSFAPVEEMKQHILVTGIVSALIFAFFSWLIANLIARPLKLIAETADRLRNGEKVQIPSHKGIKDVEVLSSSLHNLITNLTETETALDQMELHAQHDKLTGLPNRMAVDAYLDHARSVVHKGKVLTFLYMDLDGFKAVNDQYGHLAGDTLLKTVALRLRNCVRGGEIVARLGGDEFIAILHTSINHAIDEGTVIANRIILSLNEPIELEGAVVSVGCSIGGAVWPNDHEEIIEVMRLADEALYASKRKGKNCSTFYLSQ